MSALLRAVEQLEIRRSTLRSAPCDKTWENKKALTFRPTPLVVQRHRQQLQLRPGGYLKITHQRQLDARFFPNNVRFAPESGHVQCNSLCLLCANSGHRRQFTCNAKLLRPAI